MAEKELKSLNIIVSNIIFQKDGFYILSAITGTPGQKISVKGNFNEIASGDSCTVYGEYEESKYGLQFNSKYYTKHVPQSASALKRFLVNNIRGIGENRAALLLSHFGAGIEDILNKTPERLTEINGITPNLAAKIKQGWDEYFKESSLAFELAKIGISETYASKISKVYGTKCIEEITKNPYSLIDTIDGIGFKKADSIALNVGYKFDGAERISAGLIYTLQEDTISGNTYMNKTKLLKDTQKLLRTDDGDIDTDQIGEVLADVVNAGRIVCVDKKMYYHPDYYKAEVNAARYICDLIHRPARYNSVNLAEVEMMCDIHYNDDQLDAIRKSISSDIMILTGGPGTGKTKTVQGIITAARMCGRSIMCAAPTGRAAKRMAESTGFTDAMTIHRLLGYSSNGFTYNEKNKLEVKGPTTLIIDESSMMGILLASALLSAIPNNMNVVFVGDIDQLPSIEAGNVLDDMIITKVIPTVKLTEIFRQDEASLIVKNANRINKGYMPDMTNKGDGSFLYESYADGPSVPQQVKKIVDYYLGRGYNIDEIQVLCPKKKDVAGAGVINEYMQKYINGSGKPLPDRFRGFLTGDKVMQMKNNYQLEVFNGDVGHILCYDDESKNVIVRFPDKDVEYDALAINELSLAYASTVHKSQGSEYKVVIMPALNCHKFMLTRNLFYTGVTRAKEAFVLIGEYDAIKFAVWNTRASKRNSRLATLINLSA